MFQRNIGLEKPKNHDVTMIIETMEQFVSKYLLNVRNS